MCKQDAYRDLPDVGGFTTHVRPRNNAHRRLFRHHIAVIADTVWWILELDQRVPRLHQVDPSFLIEFRLRVALIRAYLSESSQDIQLGHKHADILE